MKKDHTFYKQLDNGTICSPMDRKGKPTPGMWFCFCQNKLLAPWVEGAQQHQLAAMWPAVLPEDGAITESEFRFLLVGRMLGGSSSKISFWEWNSMLLALV